MTSTNLFNLARIGQLDTIPLSVEMLGRMLASARQRLRDAAHRRNQLAQWSSAPSGRVSHPREQHLLPLMVASGAGGHLPGRKLWGGSAGTPAVSAWAFD